jgi:hypothetical protein
MPHLSLVIRREARSHQNGWGNGYGSIVVLDNLVPYQSAEKPIRRCDKPSSSVGAPVCTRLLADLVQEIGLVCFMYSFALHFVLPC